MYIKTITISGFKTYRDQVAVDPFSPRHNVVVGRNGSGKSNFFSAIRFVLSDKYTSMGREERQSLLHHGTSTTTTMSAYIEIVFDNSDGRFPTNNPELYLRRTIGLKKDEYSLDKKSASKAEVMNLLESAGFSRSNPYYIVPQGRITHLTSIDDKERLNLLKEVAGTKVYEQKRAESSKIMDDTDAKREKIAELLTYIEERLEELSEEQQELKEFQEKDKERRCLEYRLHQRELEDVTAALDKVEEERSNDIHTNNEKRHEFNEREAIVQQHEQALTTAKHALSTTSIALRQYESEMAQLVRARTEIECLIADFQQAGSSGEERREAIGKELDTLEERIEEAASKLVDLGTELDERIAEERDAKEALDVTTSKLQVLYAKQGRARQFPNQAARDKFLGDEIKALTKYEKSQQKRIDDLEQDVEGAKTQLEEVVSRSREQARDEAKGRESLKTMSEDITKLKSEVDAMQEQKKNLWREEGKLGQTVSNARTSLQETERQLQGLMDKDTSMGLRSVKALAARLGLAGVYGPVYELFDVSDKYKTAVEVTAGASLFHVVVDNDDTVTKLLEVMNKEKSGRVTFVPLNRLKSNLVQYPKADDALPMLSKLKYDKRFAMAFEQIFGRTIICQNLATAASYTRSHGLNAVTLEGDRADRKGTLTGGYHDVRRNRLDSAKKVKEWREKYEVDSARLTEVKDGLAKLEQQVSQALGQINVLDAKRKQILDRRGMLSAQGNWTAREEDNAKSRLARLESALDEAQTELKDASAKKTSYEQELETPMRQQLTDAELRSLETLTADAEKQKKALFDASTARSQASAEKATLEVELTESHRRRRDELRAKLDELEGDAGSGVLQAGEVELRQKELRNLVNAIERLSQQVEESESRAEDLGTEIAEVTQQLEEEQARQLENTRAIMRVSKNAERYLTKRQTLITRKEECSNAIRDLGILPEEAYTNYINTAADKLVKRLHKINESLKKFTHVNKKAFEQYSNFTNERQTLLDRRLELDTSAESIEELIQTLDQRKDEAIERTFKQVSKYFEEVFEELVPAGRGRLVMLKKADGYIPDEETEETDPNRKKTEVDNYTGVSIRVSFNSKRDEGQRISQLSGGQKSLVALATVFAIQKCDPAPFYLFDEIDANLDTQYRTAVAAMIHKLADTAQFITTTFRPEMCVEADKFYGVYFNESKVSNIDVIEKEEATQFLETPAADKE